jgi:ABC-2 type transport system permease protein
MSGLKAILRKEFRQIRRDPLSLGLLIFVPALLLVLYGYALSFDVKHTRVAVLDEDRTPESRALLDSLFENPYFTRTAVLERRADAGPLLARGTVRIALIVPRGYTAGLRRGETVRVQALVDGADATTATTVIGYLELLAERATRNASTRAAQGLGGASRGPAVAVEPRVWFNPELRSAWFLVPGLIAILLNLSAVVATSLSIVREKERETIEQIMVSPIKPAAFIAGKLIPYLLIGFGTMCLVLLIGRVFFGVAVRGSYMLLAFTTVTYLFAALGLGVMISAITRSQQVAFQIALFITLLPSIILSGFIFPISNMPLPVQVATYVLLPRYFVQALREIIVKAAPLSVVWPQLAAMAGLGLLFTGIAAHMTRKRI